MRGKVITIPKSRAFVGITPAYAGKSAENDMGTDTDEDHPRLCGEKI